MKDVHRDLDLQGCDSGSRVYYNQALSAVPEEMLSQASRNAKGLELLEATCQGDEVQVENLIREGIDISTKDAKGRTALRIAVERGHNSLVETLSQLGLPHQTLEYQDLGTVDPRRRPVSLLHVAAEKGYVDIVKILLKNGADIEWRSPGSYITGTSHSQSPKTALGTAAIAGQKSTAQALLDHGADISCGEDSEYLFIDGHIDVVRLFIRHQSNIHQKYDFGTTLLHLIAVRHTELIPELLEMVFDINARDDRSWTPLSWSLGDHPYRLRAPIQYRSFCSFYLVNKEATKVLLDAGAVVSASDLAMMKYHSQRPW
ncbi:ankyrin [Acephala macrosclerotiorum]|nr:ankyrin [Acephala macrosclerotiorum]